MKAMTILIPLVLAVLSSVWAEESDVLVLDSTNFQKTLDENPLMAVEFYAPWCGHCKALAPEWEKAATSLKGKVPVAKVDCTEQQALCQNYEVQGYPTLKLFRNGEASPLEVARKADPIVSFLTAELEPPVTLLKTQDEITAFLSAHPIAVLGYVDNDHDDRYTTFNKLASKLRHSVSFGAVVEKELAPENKRPGIVFHRNFDEPTVAFNGGFVSEEIEPWISRQKIPALGEINAETYQNYVGAGLPLGYVFVNPDEDNTEVFKAVKEVTQKIKDRVVVAWIDNNKFAQHGQRLGLSGKVVPSFVLDDSARGARFLFQEGDVLSTDALSKWFDSYLAGDLQPHIKSEPIPESNDQPVKTIVAHSFNSIVKDPTKDVLVEFYAPWCGHCKQLAPVWEELAEAYKNSPNVVIAKIDATANDVPPQLNIRGFPTILLFPAGSKDQPVEYQGSRQLGDFKDFLSRHTGEDKGQAAEDAGENEGQAAEDAEEVDEDHVHDEL